MYRMRRLAVRWARGFERAYALLEAGLVRLHPLLARIGYARLERPFALVERVTKGFLFDCRMCGQCVLSATGMSCPMNCPKQLRNGPCGGVRPGGFCEVRPAMRCVWVEAWEGAARMRGGDRIREVLPPVDRSLEGSSAWLRAVREKVRAQEAARDAARTALAQSFPEARRIEPAAAPLAEEPARAGGRGGSP